MAKLTRAQRFAIWYNRRAGSNAGGSHPRHNNEGLLVDEFGHTVDDELNRPIELARVTDQTQGEAVHFFADANTHDPSDIPGIQDILSFDGLVHEAYRNDGINYTNRLVLGFVDGQAPRLDINQAFLTTPNSRLQLLIRLIELPVGSPMVPSPVVINEELSLTAYTRDLNGLPLQGAAQGAAVLEEGAPGGVWTYTMQKAQFDNPMHGAHGMQRVGTQFIDTPYVADGIVDWCLDIRSIKLYDRAI